MSMKGNKAMLVKSLAKAVGWEESMMQGVADAICAAGSKDEIQELTRVHHSIHITMMSLTDQIQC